MAQYTDEYIRSLLKSDDGDSSFEFVTSDAFYLAVKCIADQPKVSTIALMKLLSEKEIRIGYPRAANMIEYMNILGLINYLSPTKDSEVLPAAKRFLDERQKHCHKNEVAIQNFSEKIDTTECIDDEQNTQSARPITRTVQDLAIPDLIKDKLINFINYTKSKKTASNLLLVGCDPKYISIITDVIANELCVSKREFNAVGTTTTDFAAVLTHLNLGDIFWFENLSMAPTEFVDILAEALRDHSMTITLGKGSAVHTVHCPLVEFRAVISVEKLDQVPISILEECYYIIDFSEAKNAFRVSDILEFSAKHNIIFEQSVIAELANNCTDDIQFKRKLIELRNRAYEANVTTITEEFLSGFKSIPDFHEIELMSGRDFELFIGNLFSSLGYINVMVTQSSHDFGADIIAEKDGVKFAIQCKRYTAPVGVSAVQEVIASKSLHDCHVACVLTNSTFTPAAKELAKKNLVILWDGNQLKDFLSKAK